MKYHTDNNIGELRASAENGKVTYNEPIDCRKKRKKGKCLTGTKEH